MGKLLVSILLGILLISLSSAMNFDNVVQVDKPSLNTGFSIGEDVVAYNPLWQEYAPVEIDNAFGLPEWLGGGALFRGAIIEHTAHCSNGCQDLMPVETTQDSALVDGIKFFTINYDDSGNEISREEQPIRSYQFYIQNGTESKSFDDYEYKCSGSGEYYQNGTEIESCNPVLSGSHIIETPTWAPYTIGQVMPAGSYTLKLVGDKRADRTVDWVMTTQGKEISEWAIWGSAGSNLTGGLYAYWSFDSNYTSLVNGWTNTSGGALIKTGGIVGSYANFTATSLQYASDRWTSNSNYTWNYWLKRASSAPDSGFINLGGSQPMQNSYSQSGAYRDYIFDSNDNSVVIDNPGVITAISDNNWHMITDKKNSSGHYFYIDGTLNMSSADPSLLDAGNYVLYMGYTPSGTRRLNGGLDEVGLWNRSLSDGEISSLYNGGAGLAFANFSLATVTQNSPIDNYLSATANVTFNCTATTPAGVTLVNMSLYTNTTGTYLLNRTNTITGSTNTTTFSINISDGTYSWACKACDSDGACGYTSNRTVTIAATAPSITINYPTTLVDYGYIGKNITLNTTINGSLLNTCWFNYNTTNRTFSCSTGQSSFISTNQTSLTVYSNNSAGNVGTASRSWNYLVLQNNFSYNRTTYESQHESYILNLTANSSLTAVTMTYNGTVYPMVNSSGGIWAKDLDISHSNMGNNSIYFTFFYGGSLITSTTFYQVVNPIQLGLCNSTLNVPYLNFTFADENTLASLNASIDSSTIYYWIGSGTIVNTLSFTNTSLNPSYAFCASPSTQNLNIEINQLKYSSTGYPQREFAAASAVYTNVTTNDTLYLLSASSGIYSAIQTIYGVGSPLPGVDIVVSRNISNSEVVIGQGTTDSSGLIQFWLNPSFQHKVVASKSGYNTQTVYLTPTQSAYTIYMPVGTGGASYNYTFLGINAFTSPASGLIPTGVNTFGLNLTATNQDLINCKLELTDLSGNSLASTTGMTNNSYCSLLLNYTGTTESKIRGKYSVILTETNGQWAVLDSDTNWIVYDLNLTGNGTTIVGFFEQLHNLPEWGSDEMRSSYSRLVAMFFIITLLVAIFTFTTGYELNNPGAAVLIIMPIFTIAGMSGWFTLPQGTVKWINGNSVPFLDQYMVIIIGWLLVLAFIMNYYRRNS